ncbi:MAG: glycerol-3-phosphate 1-O-acyltransferase PlsY [Ruminococcaceae bacterium]|nr:glycerol-3-phosphate 1-O-acyltransferase PlsY [Oscillospiraceae bacterium]
MIFNGFMARGLYQTLVGEGSSPVLFILFILACIAVPYLLGSLNFAVIISKVKYHDDIRKHGSGNGGMTNMLRTYGKGAAICTLLGDMLKAVASVTVGCALLGLTLGGYMAGFFCMLGHMFPVYYHFKGGKGVAVTAAMALMLNPVVFGILLLVFVIVVGGTKYVSLGSVMCVLIYPVILHRIDKITTPWFIANGTMWGFDVLFAFLVAVMVVFMHRSNIKRLMSGTESKISLGKKKDDKK